MVVVANLKIEHEKIKKSNFIFWSQLGWTGNELSICWIPIHLQVLFFLTINSRGQNWLRHYEYTSIGQLEKYYPFLRCQFYYSWQVPCQFSFLDGLRWRPGVASSGTLTSSDLDFASTFIGAFSWMILFFFLYHIFSFLLNMKSVKILKFSSFCLSGKLIIFLFF